MQRRAMLTYMSTPSLGEARRNADRLLSAENHYYQSAEPFSQARPAHDGALDSVLYFTLFRDGVPLVYVPASGRNPVYDDMVAEGIDHSY